MPDLRIFRVLIYILVFIIPGAGQAILLKRTGIYVNLPVKPEVYGLGSGHAAVIDSKGITYYDKRFRKQFSRETAGGESLIAAPNGKYWGILKKSKLNGFGADLNRIEVFDRRGKSCWELDGIAAGDAHISPSGEYLVVLQGTRGHSDWELFIYHRDSVGIKVYVQSCSDFVFSRDGQRFFINSRQSGLYLYDFAGKLLANFGPQQGCSFSENSHLAACFNQGMLSVIKDTVITAEIELGEMQLRTMTVSDTADRVVCSVGHRLIVTDISEGRIDWDYRVATAAENFISIDISDDGRYIALGLNFSRGTNVPKDERFREGYLYFFDINGNKMLKEKFSYDNYAAGTPEVAFWPDGRSIMVRTFGRIDVIEMQ